MSESSDLISRLEREFCNISLGDGVSLREAFILDDYGTSEERKAARSKDELHDWRKLIGSDLLCGQALCFMDAAGHRFHLPAYLATVLAAAQPDDCPEVFHALLFHLSADGSIDLRQFPVAQLILIRDAMQALRQKADEFFFERIDRCIIHVSQEIVLLS